MSCDRRDINNVIQCLLYLEEMGLISIDGNMSRERSQVYLGIVCDRSLSPTVGLVVLSFCD